MIAMPSTSCARPPCECPATMTSTRPCGRLLAIWKISESASHDDEVRGPLELRAAPSGVGRDDDHRRAPGAKLRGVRHDRRRQRRDSQAARVRHERRAQRLDRHHADDADLDSRDLDEDGRRDVRPVNQSPGRGVEQVRGEHRKLRPRRNRLEGAARVDVVGPSRRRRIDRPEIELMVADRRRRVAERVVGVDHDGAFAQIRVDPALKRIARVEEQHAAAVRGARRAQVLDVSAEHRQTAASVSLENGAVKIVGPDDRQRHHVRRLALGGDREVSHGGGAQQRQPRRSVRISSIER